MIRPLARWGALVGALALAFTAFAVDVSRAPSASAYPNANVDFLRRGLGHGRGMGQYGAAGYAILHGWSYTQILDHFYAGTTMGSVPNDNVRVQLTKFNDRDTLVQQEKGQLKVNDVPIGPDKGVRVTRAAPGTFNVFIGGGCGGPWPETPFLSGVGEVRISPANASPADHTDMLQVCESNPVATRWVRGDVIAANANGATGASDRITMNELPLESYLKGVVPRESPAAWGSAGGGKGMEALKAQAVAARSYAWAGDSPGPAKMCDTVACQVYGGIAVQNGAFTPLEDARTNSAVDATAGQVRVNGSGVVRTEFSSSTGGFTSRVEDGNPYGVREDAGDSICTPEVCNPNHARKVSIPVSTIEARHGLGVLQKVEVLARNGVGPDGGRVTRLRLVFSGGSRTFDGEEAVRGAIPGIGSSWFTVLNQASWPYHVVTRDGGVFSFGGAQFHGSLPQYGIRTPVKDIAEGPGGAYWLLGEDGGVFSFDVPFYGSMGGRRLNSPVVGMQASATLRGYWLVAGDGGIFSFGDAPFFGSTGAMRLNAPVVGMGPTPDGGGYWLVATDGGIFSFGNAPFFGSTGAMRLNQPVFAMAPTPSGRGYWLVARDGGIFAFGDAAFHGSLPGRAVRETAVEIVPSPDGGGYLIVTAEGGVYGFGNASSGGEPRDFGARAPTVGAGRPNP